jgi:hypothetical protein
VYVAATSLGPEVWVAGITHILTVMALINN